MCWMTWPKTRTRPSAPGPDAGVETFILASQSPENQSVCCNVSTDRVRTRFRRGGDRSASTSASSKCQCLLFAKTEELTNADQLFDVTVVSTGVKSVF